jgi:hypothetical protein
MSTTTPAHQLPFMDNVKEKIKNSFVELIPEDTWNQMVEQEIKNFFEQPINYSVEKSGHGYSNKTTTNFNDVDGAPIGTIFKTLVWEMCIEQTQKLLNEKVQQKMFDTAYHKNGGDKSLDNIIQEAIPIAMTKFFATMMDNMKYDLQNQMTNALNGNRY